MPKLLPYQQRWVDDLSPVKLWDADRQIGSTFAALHEVAGSLLSVRVDGGTCQALWIAGSDRDLSDARRDFTGMNSQVVWSAGVPGWAVEIMATMLGSLGLVVVDNVEPSAPLCRYLEGLVTLGIRVQVIVSGGPALAASWLTTSASAWLTVLGPVSVHQTTIMDAVHEGLGQRVAKTQGVKWSYAWEFTWLSSIAKLLEGEADCPRFHGPDA